MAISAPTPSKPYYRLQWDEPDGRRGNTSGGGTLEGVGERARDFDARLSRAAGEFTVATPAD